MQEPPREPPSLFRKLVIGFVLMIVAAVFLIMIIAWMGVFVG